MNETTKKRALSLWLVIGFLGAFALTGIIHAYSGGNPKVVVEGDYIEAESSSATFDFDTLKQDPDVGLSFGRVGSEFPNGLRTTTLNVTETSTPGLNWSFSTSSALNFLAGATSTPGGLFAVKNNGSRRVCTFVGLDITTGPQAGMDFSVTTSTAETSYSNDFGAYVIATTSVPTTTTRLIHNSANTARASTTNGFIWDSEVWLLGTQNGSNFRDTASATDYTGMAGRVLLNCFITNTALQ